MKPALLSYQRQEYLYQKIRPLVPEKYWNLVCPEPKLDISWKNWINYESMGEVKVVSEGKWVSWLDLSGNRVWNCNGW